MRVLLLGRKPVACDAVRYMHHHDQTTVVGVISPDRDESDPYPEQLCDVAASLDVPFFPDRPGKAFYREIAERVAPEPPDLVISMLYTRRIRMPMLTLGRIGCINFHPGPLPEYQGWGPYNRAILDDVKEWAVSAHFVDEEFDTGPLIRVKRFPIDASKETALSLQQKTRPLLFELFKDVLDCALRDGTLESSPQPHGKYLRKRDVLAQRRISTDDSPETIDRKIRAFWYPPYEGAQIDVGGKLHTVLTNEMVCGLGSAVHARG